MARTFRLAALLATVLSFGLPPDIQAHGSESGIDLESGSLRAADRELTELKVDDPALIRREPCHALPPTHLTGGIVVQGDGGGSHPGRKFDGEGV